MNERQVLYNSLLLGFLLFLSFLGLIFFLPLWPLHKCTLHLRDQIWVLLGILNSLHRWSETQMWGVIVIRWIFGTTFWYLLLLHNNVLHKGVIKSNLSEFKFVLQIQTHAFCHNIYKFPKHINIIKIQIKNWPQMATINKIIFTCFMYSQKNWKQKNEVNINHEIFQHLHMRFL